MIKESPCNNCLIYAVCNTRYYRHKNARYTTNRKNENVIPESTIAMGVLKVALKCSLLMTFIKEKLYLNSGLEESKFQIFRLLKENADYFRRIFEDDKNET